MVSDFQPRESYEFFLQEAPELLGKLEKGLLELKENPSLANLHALMQTTHSLKGGAACVGLNHIQTLAHNLETALQAIAENHLEINLELEELLLKAYDCLSSPLLEEIQTRNCDRDKALAKAMPVFTQLETLITAYSQKDATSTKKDITNFLFAEEVAQGLQRLETILDNPNVTETLEAIKAQIKIFRGIGELSQLPGFVAIAQTALKALETQPHSAYEIGNLALKDFQSAQIAILAGDRQLENNLSEALLKFSQSPSPPPSLGVRMDLERLELLHSLVGELVTQDNRFLLHNQQYEETLTTLNHWFNRYKKLTQNLHRWTNQLLISKKRQKIEDSSSALPSSDKFLQTSMQAVVEELDQLEEMIQDLTLLAQELQQMRKQREKTLKQVQKNLLKARMLPAGQLLNQFSRMVRDLSTKENKPVTLQLNGHKTLVDKAILDKLYDPLVHLLRNAFDHGIETPQERMTQGKPTKGTITLSIYHQGNQTLIEVQDDGRGIELEKVRATVIAMGWLTDQQASALSREDWYNYLFTSGFSTSAQVSQLSGHGMGLATVKMQVQALKGTITVTSQAGAGTSLTLYLPLTLTIVKLLVFRVNDCLLAIPIDTLQSITVVDRSEIESRDEKEFYLTPERQIPLYPHSLLTTYNYPVSGYRVQSFPWQNWQNSQKVTLLLLSQREHIVAIKIDQIVLEQDLVIKPFNEVIMAPPCLSGCTILGDGCLVPVLNGSALVDKWLRYSQLQTPVTSQPFSVKLNLALIQIVDDSLTIRQSLSATLQKAEYQVIQARDGREALAQIQQNLEIKAVICDIEMPWMNGLEFLSRTRQLRGESFPIILLSSRRNEKSRQLAVQLGASAYLTKPYIDQELLNTLRSLIESKLL